MRPNVRTQYHFNKDAGPSEVKIMAESGEMNFDDIRRDSSSLKNID